MGLLSRVFIKGLLTLLPISLTIFLIVWIAATLENAFGGALRKLLPEAFYFPGAGVVLAIALIFVVGFSVNNYLTKTFFAWLEDRLESAPIIRAIYSPLRDVTQLFVKKDSGQGQRVVMVRLSDEPNSLELMGLVTRDHFNDLPEGMVPKDSLAVFMMFSYGVGGMTAIVPKTRIRETNIPAERAMQLAITGWVKA